MPDDANLVAAVLRRYRYNYQDERELQHALATTLVMTGFEVQREVRLDARNRIDLLVGRVGVEVKVGGPASVLLRQITRYAESDLVDEILVVTARNTHRAPPEINGKPVRVLHLHGVLG